VTAAQVRNICEDAPATAFAPDPVAPYRRGVEDHREGAWWCPWRNGTVEAAQYRQGWQEAGAVWVYSEGMQDVEVMQ
jgi:hypothetical protein